MNYLRVNSSVACRFPCAVRMSEEPALGSRNGVYVGRTMVYGIPFMLDLEELVNPHVSVLGMTGSGKTYLVKSLVTRHRIARGYNVLILDWNAEYSDVTSFLGGNIHRIGRTGAVPDAGRMLSGIDCIELSGLAANARAEAACAVLDVLLEHMHSLRPEQKTKNMVVIDEAWKLLGSGGRVGQLFREARKYGFCIVTATQLVKDVDNEILANAACNFVFRMQEPEDMNLLVSSGLLDDSSVTMARGLGRGSCLVSLSRRTAGAHASFAIGRVEGFSFDQYSVCGDAMMTKVQRDRLEGAIGALCIPEAGRAGLLRFFEENGRRVELGALVRALGRAGLGRAQAIFFLRWIGIDDLATAAALESLRGNANETSKDK